MKKVLLAAVAVMFAVAATAQNREIDALVEKYTDTEGFTVVNLEGEALQGMMGMMEGKLSLQSEGENAPDIDVDDVKEVLKDIASVTVLVLNRVDDVFAGEVRSAIASQNYSPLISTTQEGAEIKILSMDIKRGKHRGNQEMVVSVSNGGNIVLVRVIGKFDPETFSKIMGAMQNQMS